MKNKQSVTEFLKMVIAGKIDEAYEKYVDLNGSHHNPYYPAGFPVLREAMKENHARFPDKQFNIKHILEEDDLVITHSHLVMKADEPGMIVVHLFRFNTVGKIVEMWDCGQAIPPSSPNKAGPF